MKKAFFTLLTFLSVQFCFAQQYIDLVKVDYLHTPENNFDTSQGKTTLQEWNADITLPLVVNEKVTFLTGLIYEQTKASFQPYRPSESLIGTTLKLGLNIKHGLQWSGTYMLLPKLSSDFKAIGRNDFQIGGAVLFKKGINLKRNYKVGIYANSELFGAFLVHID
jgi:hypothetical protein